MSYRSKIYVAFDGDTDIHYYFLMKAWTNNEKFDFEINDAHDINFSRDTSLEQSIKNQLRIRLNNSKVFILLIGENTKYLRTLNSTTRTKTIINLEPGKQYAFRVGAAGADPEVIYSDVVLRFVA